VVDLEKREVGLHITVKNGIKKHGDVAKDAIRSEIQQMVDKKVFIPVHAKDERKKHPPGGPNGKFKVIHSSIFLKEKYLPDGAFDKLKARLVAGGNEQEAVHGQDNSSPTVSTTAVLMVSSIAAKEGRKVAVGDVPGAFLNAQMKTRVYLRLGREATAEMVAINPAYAAFVEEDGTMVVLVLQAIYGLQESSMLWFETMVKVLTLQGYVPNKVEPCVFNKRDAHGVQTTVAVHVDDLLITCKNDQGIQDVADIIITKNFGGLTLKHGPVVPYVGMILDFTDPGTVRVNMKHCTDEILKASGVAGKAPTPALEDLYVMDDEQDVLLGPVQKAEFHSMVAKLLYLAKRARPDLLLAVNFLTTRVTKSTTRDQIKLDRVLKYLNSTSELGIALSHGPGPIGVESSVDASFGVHADGKSHSGVVIGLGRGPVYVDSSKQSIVTKSYSEAELVALSDGSSQVIWCRYFLTFQGYDPGPAVLYQDNMSTIKLAEKGRSTSKKTRHIAIRYFFIRDRIKSHEIDVRQRT